MKPRIILKLHNFDPKTTFVLIGKEYNFASIVDFDSLGVLRKILGNAIFSYSPITDLGNLTTIGGRANFTYSEITDLANLTTIGGSVNFKGGKVIDLGNLQTIGGDAFFGDSPITDLGNLTTIVGNANFKESQITDLGNLTTIGGYADFNGSSIKDLGKLQTIGGGANFQDSQITDLGNLTTIVGSAYFDDSQIAYLGNLQSIGGNASFVGSKITDLGNLNTIGGYADFNGSSIKDLGKLQSIRGDAYFQDSQIMDLGNLQTIGGSAYFGDREDLQAEWERRQNKYKKGGRTISQTPAPKKDQIKGSDKNRAGSSKDTESAKQIKFNEKTLNSIQNKVDEHNKQYPNKKITLESAKAVVRRGMGAYSQTYRPTISGGKPNSRVAWGLARLNAFIYKIINGKSKSGKYSQDNDLIEELGYKVQKYSDGGLVGNTFTEIIYRAILNTETTTDIYAQGNDLDKIKSEYDSISAGDFDNPNSNYNSKILESRINKYEFIGDDTLNAEDYIDDLENTDYWNLIDEDIEDIDSDSVFAINKSTDEMIDEIREFIKQEYNIGGRYAEKYMRINIYDENEDYINDLQIRIADHSQNPKNNRNDYTLSFVIANNNPTENKFYPFGEEYYYDDNSDIEDIKEQIRGIIDDKIENIKEKNYADGGLIAPNGKPSNLTPEQYKLVRTPEFKAWFGDWENDPENASKVVDENGEPLPVYHGSSVDFNLFENKPRKIGRRKTSAKGFYFTKDKWSATQYAGSDGFVKSYFLKILNYPSKQDKEVLEYSDIDDYLFDYGKTIDRFGYDGAIDVKGDFIVWNPEQIKLANGTNTTFDGNNPDIRYTGGGGIEKVKFDIEEDDEEQRITISIKNIGEVILVVSYPEYEFLEDIGEDGLEELGVEEGDMIGKIEHLEIEDKYKGQGYAKLLMNKAIEIAKEKGLMPLYLNASPMGSDGLDVDALTIFYEKLGFQVFLEQGGNNLMILKETYNNGGKVDLYEYNRALKEVSPLIPQISHKIIHENNLPHNEETIIKLNKEIIEKVKRGDDKILDLMWDIAWSLSLKHSINVITYYHKKYKNGGLMKRRSQKRNQ